MRRGADGDVVRLLTTSTSAATTRSPSAWLARGRALLERPAARAPSPASSRCSKPTSRCWPTATRSRPRAWRGRRSTLARGDRGRRCRGRRARGPRQRADRLGRGRGGPETARRGGGAGGRRGVRRDAPRRVGRLCHTVSACAEVGDFGRAEQWCRALHSWSAAWRARHFFGVCRTAYGERARRRAAIGRPLSRSCTARWPTCGPRGPALAAPTAVRLGELRARQGRLDEARRLFEAALPLPAAIAALGELDLAGGDATAAAEAAERVLRRLGRRERVGSAARAGAARARPGGRRGHGPARPRRRSRWSARQSGSRRRTCAVAGASCARRCCWRPATTTAPGGPPRTPSTCSRACSAPYEVAQARLLLSEALAALGRPERAEAEARCARGGVRAARHAPGRARPDGVRGAQPARGRHPAPRGGRAGRRPDRRAAVPQPAHRAPARGQHPHASSACPRARRRWDTPAAATGLL